MLDRLRSYSAGLACRQARPAGLVAAGRTVMTRMPSGPHSAAATRLSAWVAALAAP